jgi:HlyD family secretion protein
MDIPVEKKRFSTKRILSIIGILAIIAIFYIAYKSASGKSRLNVQKERLTISTVTKEAFKETIPINGIVLPISSIYLDALEGGRVEELFVEDGAVMKKGQPILRLSNTDLELSLANQEVAVFNVLTQMQYTKNIAEQNSMNRQNALADTENAFVEAKRVYDLNKDLYKGGALGKQDLESSENLFNYQKKRYELAKNMMIQDKESMEQQIEQASESYRRMNNTLKLMRRKVDDLVVKSPIDGQLTSLDAEIGQSINKGDRLGQIDNMNGYKVRAEIDEHYIARIFPGQKAEYTPPGKTYVLEIKKVFTQVVGGRFQVDMIFEAEVPDNIRRGQSLQLRVALSEETQALLVPKGGFYQKTGGNWVFKVDVENNIAYRKDIRIGRQSPEHYELLSGLNPGDRVITSSYDLFGDNEELILK